MAYFLSIIEFFLLTLGVSLPIARVDEFWIFSSEFSVLSVAKDFLVNKEYFISFILLFFGFIFPTIKIISRHTSFKYIKKYNLHKFSMVDIFLISFLVFASKASNFFDMKILLGFYFLLGAVFLSYVQIILKLSDQ